jgi:hypothetical protein
LKLAHLEISDPTIAYRWSFRDLEGYVINTTIDRATGDFMEVAYKGDPAILINRKEAKRERGCGKPLAKTI